MSEMYRFFNFLVYKKEHQICVGNMRFGCCIIILLFNSTFAPSVPDRLFAFSKLPLCVCVCVSLSLSLFLSLFAPFFVCVCVCVCLFHDMFVQHACCSFHFFKCIHSQHTNFLKPIYFTQKNEVTSISIFFYSPPLSLVFGHQFFWNIGYSPIEGPLWISSCKI
jgi:hypothetical protein